jgi:Na+-driven multidrug efflux pump
MEPAIIYLVNMAYGVPRVVFVLVAGNLIRGSGDALKPMTMMIGARNSRRLLDAVKIAAAPIYIIRSGRICIRFGFTR